MTTTVVCPQCGRGAEIAPGEHPFCRHCDYPLFWVAPRGRAVIEPERELVLFGKRDDALDIQIRAHRAFGGIERIGFVRLETMDRKAVFLGEDRDGPQAELVGGAEDADGDFAAVRGHEFSWAGFGIGHTGPGF